MKSALILSALMNVPLVASAALPPQYQRQRELVEIIQSSEVQAALNGAPIESITRNGEDRYTVTGGVCSVVVEIVDETGQMPGGWAGPRRFSLSVGEADCLSSSDQ